MKVFEAPIPQEVIAKNWLRAIDFSDSFVTTNKQNTLFEIAHTIFAEPPKWVVQMLKLRNWLVKPFGLAVEKPADYNTEQRMGGYVGFFKIYSVEENEILLGANDKHLNFRVSILNNHLDQQNIVVSTLVQFNNKFGKYYMKVVGPFHKIVIKSMIRKAHKDS